MSFGGKSAKPRTFLDEPALYNYAIKALGRHMRSAGVSANVSMTCKARYSTDRADSTMPFGRPVLPEVK